MMLRRTYTDDGKNKNQKIACRYKLLTYIASKVN